VITFVRALLELAVMSRLLDYVEDLLGEGFVGDGPRWISIRLVRTYEQYGVPTG
jgi:hypothetical protein